MTDIPSYRQEIRGMPLIEQRDYLLALLDIIFDDEGAALADMRRRYGLSPTQARVLCALQRVRPGTPVSVDSLLTAVYGDRHPDDFPTISTLRVTIGNLRKRLAECGAPVAIEALRGVGYVLADPAGDLG